MTKKYIEDHPLITEAIKGRPMIQPQDTGVTPDPNSRPGWKLVKNNDNVGPKYTWVLDQPGSTLRADEVCHTEGGDADCLVHPKPQDTGSRCTCTDDVFDISKRCVIHGDTGSKHKFVPGRDLYCITCGQKQSDCTGSKGNLQRELDKRRKQIEHGSKGSGSKALAQAEADFGAVAHLLRPAAQQPAPECDHQWKDYGTLSSGNNPTLEIESCIRCGVQRKKQPAPETSAAADPMHVCPEAACSDWRKLQAELERVKQQYSDRHIRKVEELKLRHSEELERVKQQLSELQAAYHVKHLNYEKAEASEARLLTALKLIATCGLDAGQCKEAAQAAIEATGEVK